MTLEAVSTISGTLRSPSDVDLYTVCVTGGGSFSASTVGGVRSSALDTQLFLFSRAGAACTATTTPAPASASRCCRPATR